MKRKTKRIVQLVSAIAVVLSVIAFTLAPTLPAAVTFFGGLAALLGSLFTSGEETEERLISAAGRKLVTQVSTAIIPNGNQRQEWSSFDVRFLYECIKDTPRGWAFAGDAAATFVKPEHDRLFGLGVRVYNECCKRVGKDDSDYRVFNIIAKAYLSARLLLRSGGAGAG
jgi:hypothetical protein